MKNLKSSVHKTFAILEHFSVQKSHWGVTELANSIGANKSTVYRFLSDLESLGILYKNTDSEKYSLGLKIFELGNRVQLKTALVNKTHPELIKVASSITETVHIAILKNNQVFYIDKEESPQGLKISSQIGSFNPAYATALGKILLAYKTKAEQEFVLNKLLIKQKFKAYTSNTITSKKTLLQELNTINKVGYAIDREEFELGLICVAIPIFNANNEVVASLSASGPASRFKEEEVLNYVTILKAGAINIKEKLGSFKP